jgi:16S rRNA (cytosine967-C5)-methyltransferase
MTAPARVAAFHALRAVDARREDLPAALARARTHLSDERDRALTADIVTGTLRWQQSVDHLITHFARRPLDRIDADVVTILRLSIYQLLHLDRVPAAAIVDDAVDLTRGARKQSATGFVNAVLRSILRGRDHLPLPPRPEDPADRERVLEYLTITHSHPDWLAGRWLDRHGFAASERWVQFNNTPAPLTLRANRLRCDRDSLRAALASDGITTDLTSYAPDGLIVTEGNPLRTPPDGAFVVQDEASQIVTHAVGARPGERVLDLCASPGGKTTAMVADMQDTGVVIACDVRPRRVALLRDTVHSSGAKSVQVVQVAPEGPLPFSGPFDRILIDAPCSGLGTVRRDPDIRWRRTETDLRTLADAQVQLIRRVADLLRPGGRLVYATCSSEPEENEHVVDRFLREHPAFAAISLRGESSVLDPLLDDRGMLRTLPFAHGLEAFFAAALLRGEATERHGDRSR